MEKRNSNIALWIGCGLSIVCSIVLFILVLSGDKAETKETKTTAAVKKNKTLSSDGLKVAYINTDTVMAKYQMAIDMEKDLQDYQKRLKNELESKLKKFQTDYENYMKNGANLTLTQQKQTEQDLTKRQQELPQLEQQMMLDLQERQVADNKKMLDAVYAFIRDYNKKHQNFDIILSKSYLGSPVLYIDEGMDITNEIVEGLNKEYEEYKKEN
ncbi:MAG: OmpH family outer membrane protein [Bacteroidales bacterium]|nr:OmpH family outer membrane protein [Bacteroidales bacterium]